MVESTRNYADCFGHQWNAFRRTQLDSHTGTTITTDRARRILGPDCLRLLNGPGRVDVLEVGCGAGRFTEVLLGMPASHVTSVDFSSAVEANQANVPQGPRHRVLQADVRQLPFAPGQFDLVFCVGVVQHTPNSEQTMQCLLRQAKPGGWVVF
ncbi:MAG TPA: class I SAM-dependent methyltransferase, partial [Pirellulaceae bacterium]